eukprot:gene49933-66885_t
MSMLAAKNVVANRILHFASRRFLDTIRGVDTLIWALIWINVVGLGPFAGILAIMTSDFGSFGKLFSEAIEASDRKPVDGVLSAGGSELHGFRFGILPQVLPVLLSQVLYYFESNTRSATIIGIVGAGGIGLYLANEIAQAEWQRAPSRHDRSSCGSNRLSGSMQDAPGLPRYALYYAPRAEEALAVTASRWLGRSPDSGETRDIVPVGSISRERLSELVADPGLYGFHGTLKPPMGLADRVTERDLLDAVGAFAATERQIDIPSVALAELSDFLALV